MGIVLSKFWRPIDGLFPQVNTYNDFFISLFLYMDFAALPRWIYKVVLQECVTGLKQCDKRPQI